ncbi:MAG: GNAT family N-acetyltransferase [bacterium]|nr:GNAT family N-acetyltransferase [bacterium]
MPGNGVIRRVLPDEMPRFTSIHVQAWNMDPGSFNPDEAELEDSRVLAVEGDLVAVLFLLRRDTWMGPDRVPQVGLGGVATPAEHRRRGYCRALLGGVLEEARASGDALSLLWPFSHAFYRKLGWEVGGRALEVTLPLASLPGRSSGWSACPVDPDSEAHLAELDAVYSRSVQEYNGCLVREPRDWKRKLSRKHERRFAYLLRRPGGGAAAYAVYAFKDLDHFHRRMDVRELLALDGEAHKALLGFLRDHDSQAREIQFYLPEQHPLLYSWPDRPQVTYRDAFMLRVVDVKRALEGLTYPGEGEMALNWRVEDPLCPWNHGTFRVTWSGPRCTLERLDGSPQADLACDIATLSGIYAGHLPAGAARVLGRLRLDGDEGARLSWLRRAFGRRPGHLLDFF